MRLLVRLSHWRHSAAGDLLFTLQAIAYAVDVYRGTIPATRSFFDFTLFLSFFPQLVAGPIMRAKDLIYQFSQDHPFRREDLEVGLRLVALGLFKKTIVADPVGETVDKIFGNPDSYDWISMWVAVFLHTLQIYGDFSGYSDVAIGTGRIMGFRIPLNFRRPLLAVSVTDIWRRWHISLSTWIRDYIYIPLGGNRVSLSRSYFNLTMTWVAAGIWHGADWTFILWGVTNALFISLERILFAWPRIKGFYDGLPRFLRMFYALLIFSFALFFFRAHPVAGYSEGVLTAFAMIRRAVTFAPGETLLPALPIFFAFLALLLIELLLERDEEFFAPLWRRPTLRYGIPGALLVVAFFIYSVTTSPQFIYFQF